MEFKNLLKGLVGLFLPADCKICGGSLEPLNGSFICEDCWNKVEWLKEPYCSRCSKPLSRISQRNPSFLCLECQKSPPYFKKVFVPILYQGVMKRAIYLLKYNKKRGVLRAMRRIMESYFNGHCPPFPHLDLIIPIPLHRGRLKERGFNQAELLAEVIAKYFNLKLIKNNLLRIKPTPSLTKLGRKERIKNIKGAFQVKNKDELQGRSILLVDDVYTTGTTVKEASKVLKKAKAKEIYIFTLARAC